MCPCMPPNDFIVNLLSFISICLSDSPDYLLALQKAARCIAMSISQAANGWQA